MKKLLLTMFVIGNFTFASAQTPGAGMSSSESIPNDGISIRIVKIEDKKVPQTMNVEVTFEMTNETDEEVFVPNPRVAIGLSFVQPEFFDAVIGGASCEAAGLVDMANKKKGSEDFTRIGPSESALFTVNPRDLNFNPTCKFKLAESQTIQIRYSAMESFFDPTFLSQAYENAPEKDIIMEIYAKVVRGTVVSQVVEFEGTQ